MYKEFLSISEMAKLRHMTAETLRHYDRIGLIKPHRIDATTGYRYYSIHQYEVLGTIRELKEIGLSLEEIRTFLVERNLEKSLSIIESHQTKLQRKIKQLVRIESSLQQKTTYLKRIAEEGKTPQPNVRYIEERYFLTTHDEVADDIELSYATIEIEKLLELHVSLVAGSFLGLLFDVDSQIQAGAAPTSILMAQTAFPNDYPEMNLIRVPAGYYVCLRHFGQVWDRTQSLKQAKDYLEKNEMRIDGKAIQMVEVDVSVTDRLDESLFEIQIPIAFKRAVQI
ncbi:MerR family transcriptional regulator [Exiguobacterium sp. OS-77]|uniref:MerR family transcriptional regulator n=1 Tax=Exiguobacterium sp. OS-77 TaxID=1241306 RepID=UPI000400D731|nr:MerR family transcriptional regulator [Exiguobacterium sp. OS-77]